MVCYNNAVVTVLEETLVIDDSGDSIIEYTQIDVIEGDVQPHALTQDEIKLYGISTTKGGVKLFLYNGLHDGIKAGNRASVASSFTGKTDLYSIMPVNAWSKHGECLLIPVENEDQTPEPTPEPTPGNNGTVEEEGEEENDE